MKDRDLFPFTFPVARSGHAGINLTDIEDCFWFDVRKYVKDYVFLGLYDMSETSVACYMSLWAFELDCPEEAPYELKEKVAAKVAGLIHEELGRLAVLRALFPFELPENHDRCPACGHFSLIDRPHHVGCGRCDYIKKKK